VGQGATQPGGVARGWAAPPHGAPSLWSPFISALDSVSCWEIGTLAFVSYNSENIFCVAFLKHKTAENRVLALWHLVSRLVLENA
jgi:hypothetical protein